MFPSVFDFSFSRTFNGQTFPTKPLRIIVPFPAGGIVDLMARSVNEKLAAGLGQPVLVEARPGANGSLGTEAVAKSDPDGHTLVLATLSHVTTPALTKTPWHPTRDFAGVALMGHVANVALVHPDAAGEEPARVRRLRARRGPGKINYINAGIGTSQTMSDGAVQAEHRHRPGRHRLQGLSAGDSGHARRAGAVLLHAVRRRRAARARSGKLRALAIAAPARSSQFPDLPTMAEAGFAESQVISWYALPGPGGDAAAPWSRG